MIATSRVWDADVRVGASPIGDSASEEEGTNKIAESVTKGLVHL